MMRYKGRGLDYKKGIKMIIRKCNKCGKDFDDLDTQEEFSIHTTLGYGSKYDGDVLQLDLCCDCMGKLIDACKISPLKSLNKIYGE